MRVKLTRYYGNYKSGDNATLELLQVQRSKEGKPTWVTFRFASDKEAHDLSYTMFLETFSYTEISMEEATKLGEYDSSKDLKKSELEGEVSIPKALYVELEYLGIIDSSGVRENNVGKSDYRYQLIQPWALWLAYPNLTAFDKDILKRVLRTKREANMTPTEARILDYEKIIHTCQERIRQLNIEKKYGLVR